MKAEGRPSCQSPMAALVFTAECDLILFCIYLSCSESWSLTYADFLCTSLLLEPPVWDDRPASPSSALAFYVMSSGGRRESFTGFRLPFNLLTTVALTYRRFLQLPSSTFGNQEVAIKCVSRPTVTQTLVKIPFIPFIFLPPPLSGTLACGGSSVMTISVNSDPVSNSS